MNFNKMNSKSAKTFLYLTFVALLHAFLTIYSFSALFGLSFMYQDNSILILKKYWQTIMAITWQPLLWIMFQVRLDGVRLFDRFPWWLIFALFNSFIAVLSGYILVKIIIHYLKRKP